jgi:hypothetical protein
MSLPAAGNFSLKQRVSSKYIYTSEFYPQSLREKTMFIECPQITTVYATNTITTNNSTANVYRGLQGD